MGVLQKIPTGCKSLDDALDGGIPSKSLTLVYGEAETGKTTLTMQAVINCAMQGYKILFVDCDDTFSSRRLSQIAAEKIGKVAELIILMKPHSFHEQAFLIDHLTDYVTKNFGLIVVDTVTSLYSARVSENPEKTFELNRELNRQMGLLAQLAKTNKIAVLVTSQVRSTFEEGYVSVEPVATRVLKFWAETIIAMKPTENSKIIKAIVEKSAKVSRQYTCFLQIREFGLGDNPIT
ncbi:MAG: ATPase domain-containing protein [Candidatus Bathyarchaeales archaeon]